MKKKLTTWKKIYNIAYLVLMTLLNLKNPESEKMIETKIKQIEKILKDDHQPRRRNRKQTKPVEQTP